MTSFSLASPGLVDQGQGEPTLVFLHYFGGAAASWQGVIQRLKSDFRCVALDLPGFGDAPPLQTPSLANYSDFIWDSLSTLGIDRFILIGHSMGAKIALQVAASSLFEEPRQVVLIAPSPPTQEPMPDAERQRLLHHHPSEANAATTVDNATRLDLSQEQRSLAIQTHTVAADSAWRWWLQTGMHHSIADQMMTVRVPVTVIASPDDPVIPFDIVPSEVLDQLPQAQLIELTGSGHLMPLEAPEQLAKIIRQQISKEAKSNR